MDGFPLYHRIADDENLFSIAVLYYGTPEAWVHIKRANSDSANGGVRLGDDWENLPKDNLLLIPALKEKVAKRKIFYGGHALIGEELPVQGGHKLYELVKRYYGPACGGGGDVCGGASGKSRCAYSRSGNHLAGSGQSGGFKRGKEMEK